MFPTELCVVPIAQSIHTLRALRPARQNNGFSPRGQSSTLGPSPPESLHATNLIALPEGVTGWQDDWARSTTVLCVTGNLRGEETWIEAVLSETMLLVASTVTPTGNLLMICIGEFCSVLVPPLPEGETHSSDWTCPSPELSCPPPRPSRILWRW